MDFPSYILTIQFFSTPPLLPNPGSYCSLHERPINWDEVLGQRIMTLLGKSEDQEDSGSVPKNHLTWVRNQASFVLKREKYDLLKTFWWRNPLFLQLSKQILWQCSYKPIILHQDNCYFPFCNFLTLREWKRGVPLKTRNLRIGAHLSFRLQATFFYKTCRASLKKHRKQSTRVRVKGIDALWSQAYSLLQACIIAPLSLPNPTSPPDTHGYLLITNPPKVWLSGNPICLPFNSFPITESFLWINTFCK